MHNSSENLMVECIRNLQLDYFNTKIIMRQAEGNRLMEVFITVLMLLLKPCYNNSLQFCNYVIIKGSLLLYSSRFLQ